MISRRLVRIKTLQTLYAWKQNSVTDIGFFSKELSDKLLLSQQFYIFLLDLPYQLLQYALRKEEMEKGKYYPNIEKIKQYSVLKRTPLISNIHQELLLLNLPNEFIWESLEGSFETLYQDLLDWDFVRDYDIFSEPNETQQKEFIENLYYAFIETHQIFNDSLEELYPAWPEDSTYILREMLKTIIVKNGEFKFDFHRVSSYEENEEIEYGRQLLNYTIRNSDDYEKMTAEVTDNWDPSRIAVIDLLIIKLTLTEFFNFPDIPVKVTINEYLEITKQFSTPNSSKFVNGILDKLRINLESRNQIKKSVRGLKEN